MRTNMTDPKFQEHPMNTQLYYQLLPVTDNLWDSRCVSSVPLEEILFQQLEKRLLKIDESLNLLNKYNYLFSIPGIFIAGGSIFASLFDGWYQNIDIFLYGCNEANALIKIKDIIELINIQIANSITNIIRTKNAITIGIREHKTIQIILRLYKSPSEILHGFDIDCCCCGYNGKNIWITQRMLFSIVNRRNTINFDTMSPSYINRLTKYASRGMSIHLPDFDRRRVNEKMMMTGELSSPEFSSIRGIHFWQVRITELNSLSQLDLLIYNEHKWRREISTKKFNQKRLCIIIDSLAEKTSDYIPIVPEYNIPRKQQLTSLLFFLLNNRSKRNKI